MRGGGLVRACERNGVPVQRERVAGAGASVSPTLGVEEEFHVVDLATRRATARGPELLALLPDPSFVPELHRSIVETNTLPCVTLDDLRREVARRRHQLIETADQVGLGLLAAGTAPLAEPDELDITANLRYGLMLQDYERLAREQVICGCQVHVGIDDRDLAVAVARQVAADLPVLLAASASSPFWHGTDTGYASYRTMVWARWPTSGPFPAVTDAADYARLVDDLIATGVIADPGMVYYDIRPSAHVPTLELRLSDACPRVDDVVLIAGLFRAATVRAVAEITAGGRPAVPPPGVELLRAATWRAARSGLTGELVDPSTLRPVPATGLLARLVAKLRPELEAAGDWDTVSELAAELAASGGSATRQRAALTGAGTMEDVVDLLLTQTRGSAEPLVGASLPDGTAGLLVDYPSARTDEAMPAPGTPHVLSSDVLTTLDRLGPRVLSHRQQASARHQLDHDVTFAVAGETRPFPIDLVPRVVGSGDWHELRRGIEQRAVALEMFLRDVYGRRAVVRDGVLPAPMIETSAALRPAGALVPDGAVRACVVGVDVVRDATGAWRVLEDNLRVPSGLAYALQARRMLAEVLPELRPGRVPASVESAPAMLRAALQAAAPVPASAGGHVQVALLSQGVADAAWWEHRTLAERMSVPLVRPGDLEVTGSGVFIRQAGRRVRVDVLYRRLDEESLEDLPAGDSLSLGRRLRGAIGDGLITLANAPGNGIGDDKAIYSYVGAFIRYYLGEEPLLPDVPTYLCGRPEHLPVVLDRIPELVVKPVDGYGGSGVLIGPAASRTEVDTARREILATPHRWIAQEVVQLSTHPTLAAGRLEPRHVDLRVFATVRSDPATGRPTATALPAPLTRMAPAGSLVVNSSRGGGAKDTWIVA